MTFKEELEKYIREELEVCRRLRDITFEKTDVLIEDEVQKLTELTKKEEDLVNKIGVLEVGRQKLLDNWGVDKSMTLLQIIPNIPEDTESLEKMGEELVRILQDINVRNKLNGELLRDSLEWIDFNVNLISNTEAPTTYGKGNKNVKLNNNLFDRKV